MHDDDMDGWLMVLAAGALALELLWSLAVAMGG